MTNEELERFYYITNHPLHHIMAAMVDLEKENNDLYWENDALQTRLSMEKYDE